MLAWTVCFSQGRGMRGGLGRGKLVLTFFVRERCRFVRGKGRGLPSLPSPPHEVSREVVDQAVRAGGEGGARGE